MTRAHNGARRIPRRTIILDSVEKLLETKPLRDLGVEEIAKESGITRTRFYFYFDSKYDAYGALLERVVAEVVRVHNHPDNWFSRAPDRRPRQALFTTVAEVVDVWWTHRAVLREAADMWNAPEAVRKLWLSMMDAFITRAAATIERERDLGIAPVGPPAIEIARFLLWQGERALFMPMLEETDSEAYLHGIRSVTPLLWLRAIYLDEDPEIPA